MLEAPHLCHLCGANPKRLDVGHINGKEEDCRPKNLMPVCRSCNVRSGNTLRAAGIGRLTRQYNPQKGKGATSYGQYVRAALVMRGQAEAEGMSQQEAYEMVMNTPPADRSRYASMIYNNRKKRATAASKEVPW